MPTKPILISTAPILARQMTELEAEFEVHRLPRPESERAAWLSERAPYARFLQTSGAAGATRELMLALPKLEIIANMGVGTDAIDLIAARELGIIVTNTPGVLDADVADLAWSLVIMCSRKLSDSERYLRSGKWLEGAYPLARSVAGKRLGIVGLGRIGKAIARRAEVSGVEIGYFGRQRQNDVSYPYFSKLRDLAAWADFLVLSCPGGPETFHLVDASVLEAVGPDGILVNISRGTVVDEVAMTAALRAGSLGAAGLDVFEDEPHVPAELIAMDNVVLTPHVGSATVETRNAMADLVVANLVAYKEGRAPVTPV